ncbi:MAG TPA: ATP-binding protein [Rudaea sp.]|nr:ATP-binding protein [Rudaea sp.]
MPRRNEDHLLDSLAGGGEMGARALLEGIPQLVWRAAEDGAWRWASPQWTAFTGLSDADSRDAGWFRALHQDDRERAARAWREARERGEYHVDFRLRTAASGEYRWFQTRATPMLDSEGGVHEWFGTCTDIEDQMQARRVLAELGHELESRVEERTRELRMAMENLRKEVQQRERAEERLRQSEKLKAIGQLTGGIAHDFNNMLQTISGSLGVIGMLAQQGRIDQLDGYIERANRGVTRAAALTHRLLAFGRQQTLEPEAASLDDIVVGMEDMIRRTVGPEIEVELKLCDGDWLVMCDTNQMESALLNLCINARDAMPNGGWLTVTTQENVLADLDLVNEEGVAPGRFSSVLVSDTGGGMAEETLSRAFEPFFTTKTEGRGTGLGLSQIYGFVRQSGGVVKIESTVGAGTTVRISLPYVATRTDRARSGDDEPTVLLVEDEPDVRELTVEQLRAARFRVIEASNADAAMRLTKTGTHFDVLVSDVRLPGGMDGVQLAETMRGARPDLPVILVSGFATGRTLPGIPIIDKPYEFSVLLDQIRTNLQDRRPS